MTYLRILSGAQVDSILDTLPPQKALASQALVFSSFTRQARLELQPTPTTHGNTSTGPSSIQTPHRTSVNSSDMTMLFMPSRAPTLADSPNTGADNTTTACKIVSVPTRNSTAGLPASTILMDEVSGTVKAIVNARKLTALRNACGSALFLSLFPAPTTGHLLLFGSGAQCTSHATLFLRLYPFSRVTFVVRSANPRAESSAAYLRSTFPKADIAIAEHRSPSQQLSELVSTADVIVTATPSLKPLFDSSPTCPKPGARVIMIGSYKPEMHEIDGALMKRAGKVVVDSRSACMREAGELIDAGEEVAGGTGLIELGEELEKRDWQSSGRELDDAEIDEVIIFKSVGLGIQDVAIATLVLEEAERWKVGTVIDDYDV